MIGEQQLSPSEMDGLENVVDRQVQDKDGYYEFNILEVLFDKYRYDTELYNDVFFIFHFRVMAVLGKGAFSSVFRCLPIEVAATVGIPLQPVAFKVCAFPSYPFLSDSLP